MQHKKNLVKMAMGIALAGFLAITFAGVSFASDKKFGLEDIPEIENKTPIHMAIYGGLETLAQPRP